MLFSVLELTSDWGIHPKCVLHVGAHLAEESKDYTLNGWGPVTWVEGQPELVAKLRQTLDKETNHVFQGYVWDQSGENLKFNIASNSQSSSLLEFGTCGMSYPEISFIESYSVTTTTLQDLLSRDSIFEFINIDLQGSELRALRGIGPASEESKWVYSEVNKVEVYKNCTLVSKLDAHLLSLGFVRRNTRWVSGKGWGDALYSKKQEKSPVIKFTHRLIRSLLWKTEANLKYIVNVLRNRKHLFIESLKRK
jgi:FkbM family methyltransferase